MASALLLAFQPRSRVMLSPSTDESVCEIDTALPLAHEDTTTSEASSSITREMAIMMIDGFTQGIFPRLKGCTLCVVVCEAISRIEWHIFGIFHWSLHQMTSSGVTLNK